MNKYKPIAWIANTQTRTIKLFIKVAGKNGEDQHLGVCRTLESPMTSYYIQDLRLVLPTEVFELRVNKHCANVNALFREWLYQPLCGDLTQAEDLFKHRFDLLCSLCFPTIDPPQLLRISKLCALVVLASDGLIQVENTSPAGRSSRYAPCIESIFYTLNHPPAMHSDSTSHPDLLNPEHLLGVARSIRTGRAQELQYPPPTYLSANVLLRLTGSLLSSFYSSQQTSTQNPHPGLPGFLAVLESAYDHKFSEELTNATLETLWRYTVNILTWCQVIRQRKRFLIEGGLNSSPGPCFVRVFTPTRLRSMHRLPPHNRTGFHPAGSREQHPAEPTI